jgi:hypothetical protein
VVKNLSRNIASFVLFSVFGLLALGSGNSTSTSSKGSGSTETKSASQTNKVEGAVERPKAVAVEVTATKLWNDYQANEVAADEKYKGKTLLVSGSVASIDKDFADNIVVRLSTPNQFMSTMATLDDSQKSKAAQLSKGQPIRLRCEGRGMIIGSPSLDDCTIE